MLGIIGGSGLYSIEGLKIVDQKEIDTPFGKPSSPLVRGKFENDEVWFLPRHGVNHQFLPTEVNYRANIWALKKAGVRKILSISAVGSLSEEIAPGDLVIADQYFDFTRGKRASSFFGEGIVAHTSTAEPACSNLSQKVKEVTSKTNFKVHHGKTYACVEGPRFGTRAESHFLRAAKCHIIGMTNVPEAFLAREAQICYCTLAVCTDYDCWLDDPSMHATLDKLLALYKKTLEGVRAFLPTLIQSASVEQENCTCRQSLKEAVLTPENAMTASQKEYVRFLKQ